MALSLSARGGWRVSMAPLRDWSLAEPKREEGCRLCGGRAELAHVIGRARDERVGSSSRKSMTGAAMVR